MYDVSCTICYNKAFIKSVVAEFFRPGGSEKDPIQFYYEYLGITYVAPTPPPLLTMEEDVGTTNTTEIMSRSANIPSTPRPLTPPRGLTPDYDEMNDVEVVENNSNLYGFTSKPMINKAVRKIPFTLKGTKGRETSVNYSRKKHMLNAQARRNANRRSLIASRRVPQYGINTGPYKNPYIATGGKRTTRKRKAKAKAKKRYTRR